ncbi:MAG TPA: D-alanyl-D-alanine-carboxypeptidase/endopeptidase AmpH [Erwinia persicina]|uniref:D-alanyl-D-alanine-carboxypeptidase/endopeptidase AmpH n=1 Tax=Erwinia persicina TaxID=55211 RepID=A0A357VVA2_9GAMM|nr:D-alanyl-D-alanine-carboxypeptidase/endopeptidase AmpH [Erwinia persicina]AXU97563.1 D-alanyl-D-alanine-carboxypeptidase/endopeptidase AmpH [Erwinia persicina]MBD8107089.1 D-alanyl-D-alanine-carboxypeptidase/endopeptidase AmpH [Erwinia persicina]MBD8162848.1 D-alanyl-D-alanine-carboxypeptidase/endopeptidase AmpH [Erwinia persicina]MBD8167664.1 D-alanyl-D-alanine-carboxypeptidase/endopeptidase AmpH [Erwinia persicina]MBD8210169.1 D-alanyl-D-alanine-carboxypeptidase/endopeptidase AmpH [Erwini
MKSPLYALLLLPALALPLQSQAQPKPDPLMASQTVERYADNIFYNTKASGMAMVAIDANQRIFVSRGTVRPGSQQRPQKDSLVRIASLSKLMTSEVMVKLSEQGRLKLNDPLSKYAPPGSRVPEYNGQPIRLINLATHTSALPREQPGGKANRAVFTWPTNSQRWNWLRSAQLKWAPGQRAGYSNLAFDLLGDALARAGGKPYPALLQELVTRPLGMKDTTFTPSPDQCRRLMIPAKSPSPCNNSLAAIGSGGVYSTPDDMGRWMQQFLASDVNSRSAQADRLQTMIYQRSQLTKVDGMDVPGRADALGMGWVYMAPRDGRPGIIEKTGGGGGFITYMAMVPQYSVGVFIVVARSPETRFTPMSDGVNNLLTELIGNTSGSAQLAASIMAN